MPLITLTSDIGDNDYLVAAIKGQLWQMMPSCRLVDVSHRLTPFNYPQTSYVCRSTLQNFPEYTFHLVLVNLFENNNPHLLLAYYQQQYILCADNGLLPMILEESPEMVIGLPIGKEKRDTIAVSRIFGRAIKAVNDGDPLQKVGVSDLQIVEKNPLQPMLGPDWIDGQVIFIDRFENIVVNITRATFERERQGRKFSIAFKRGEVIDAISETYADVPEGEKLALFNAAGYLEIAINKGNAAGLLGFVGYSEKESMHLQNRLFYQTIRIFFN
ncbi:MAG: SAM-dependent chlorinase/fluorinase [Chitinophagaceae bacterium]|nr:SAM-dependent chlorinase/fluorinase [Chitinophagaceae bacterium]MCW5926064.1 SAM-dependent chlorinase/fluorinase [Chitinophagaceae bacterium]